MTTALHRVAVWWVVDELVTRLYRAAAQLPDERTRELVRQATLSLAEPVPTGTLLGRLGVVRALLRLFPGDARHLESAVDETAATIRRLEAQAAATGLGVAP